MDLLSPIVGGGAVDRTQARKLASQASLEKGERNFSAYVPDLPGCVSVGDTLEEARAEIREAIEFHLECMR
jgi:predicted RNase H-like HicB family nuclease